MIRSQLQEMFGSTGFDNQRDISAITVNRWAHGYAYYANALFDDMDKMPEIIERARQPVGRIAIANSDSDWGLMPIRPSTVHGVRLMNSRIWGDLCVM